MGRTHFQLHSEPERLSTQKISTCIDSRPRKLYHLHLLDLDVLNELGDVARDREHQHNNQHADQRTKCYINQDEGASYKGNLLTSSQG